MRTMVGRRPYLAAARHANWHSELALFQVLDEFLHQRVPIMITVAEEPAAARL